MSGVTVYVTFGQRHRREPHPVDGRAHPDGWFEYVAESAAWADAAARRHLSPGPGVPPVFAFAYRSRPDQRLYPLGCLARFLRVPGGGVVEAP